MTVQTLYSNNTSSLNFNSLSSTRTTVSKTAFETFRIERLEQGFSFKHDALTRLTQFEIIWIKKGNGIIKIDACVHDINANTIYCNTPGQHRYIESNNSLEGYYISFSTDFLSVADAYPGFSFGMQQYSCADSSPIVSVDDETQYEMEEIILKMMKECENYFFLRSEILKGLLKIFLIYISRKYDSKGNGNVVDKDVEVVRKFIALFKKDFITKKLVSDYAFKFIS